MSGRPITNPDWATNDAYPVGSEDWAETPNKIDPGDTPRENGFIPNQQPTPMAHNYIFGAHGEHIRYHDAIELQNWSVPYKVASPSAHDADVVLHYNEGTQRIYAGCQDILEVSKRGDTVFGWSAEPSYPGSGPPGISWIASQGTEMVVGGGVHGGYAAYHSSVWSLVTTATVFEYLSAVAWGPPGGGYVFMLGGLKNDGTPMIVVLPTNITTPTVINKTMPADYSDARITHMIAAQTNALSMAIAIAGDDSAGILASGLAIYTCVSNSPAVGANWILRRITSIVRPVLEAFYDAKREAFYIIDSSGNVYKSADGINWDATGVIVHLDNAKLHTMQVWGGIWTAILETNRLAYSVDEGATWNVCVYPFEDGTGPQPYNMIHTYLLDDRIAVVANPTNGGDDKQFAAFSLRNRGV